MPDETRAFPGPSDLLSSGNTPAETHAKVADYLASGTSAVWVVDPDKNEVSVYEEAAQAAAPRPRRHA